MEFFLGAFEKEWESRRAALLHERSLGRGKADAEEERRRRRGGGASALSPVRGFRGNSDRRTGTLARATERDDEPSMRSRFAALASGSQPAVVKMASFGGGGRLGAMITYVSRNGGVVVENERGEQLRGRDELSGVRGEWDHLMKNRAESRDIATFTVEVNGAFREGGNDHEHSLALLKRGLGDRSLAYAVRPGREGTSHTIEGVAVLRDSNGERLTADKKASEIVQDRFDGGAERGETAAFRFTGYGNGTDYGTSRLRDLVERHGGAVYDEKGKAISDEKQAGELVQQEWRNQLHSRKPRDVMHLVLSARAGTDSEAFHAAARDFLAEEFTGYRYVFSLHDPSRDPKAEEAGGKRPHVHVHAVIAMRSDMGDRIETTIPTFRRWRATIAEKALAHGINMEMTDRRERGSAAAYGRNQVRPTSRLGRTEHEGTSESAQRRYDAKRSDHRSFARTEISRNYTDIAKREWEVLASQDSDERSASFAKEQVSRLELARSEDSPNVIVASEAEKSLSQFETYLVTLQKIVFPDERISQMNRSEFEAYEKRVEMALFQAERVMPPEQKTSFEEIAAAAREHVDVRRELMEQAEQSEARSERVDEDRGPAGDEANQRWDEAVARHGLRTVEAANQLMLEVEHFREAIELADVGEVNNDKETLQASLNLELARAGELGAAGNRLIREIAEVDEELRTAIENAERARQQRGEKGKGPEGAAAGVQVRADNEDRSGREEAPDRDDGDQPQEPSASPASQRLVEGTVDRNAGDTRRTDPVQQHVRRLEQLQREADERRERDQNDRER
ncbi:conjugal transfer protein TraA (plasmid) [Rhizobium sp. CB3171]|uniref:conjugal transfer protein TraA n=1 Tax=Rhizobium sp. CB3171 TaxID=3039157 RepID=UPI0024B11D80|nr:conjugal transfer protein TraA [Rhizobium sp. CB3171]WFU05896.1 conjugal transfer protein TraA [Rhizobium sp. CB3171]